MPTRTISVSVMSVVFPERRRDLGISWTERSVVFVEYARGGSSQIDGSFAWRVTGLPCGSSGLKTSRPSPSKVIFFVGRPGGKQKREKSEEGGEKESRREDGEEQRRWSRNVARVRPRPRELLTIHFCFPFSPSPLPLPRSPLSPPSILSSPPPYSLL